MSRYLKRLYRGINSEQERRDRDRWNIHPIDQINRSYYGRGFGPEYYETYADMGVDSREEEWLTDPYLPAEELAGTYSDQAFPVYGPYTGAGPRNYQRPDERILDDVHERMTRHGQLDASKIIVKAENGDVTLEGSVDTRRMKHLAEDIAASVPGVFDVHNYLRVQKL
jgi:hypothetical protein